MRYSSPTDTASASFLVQPLRILSIVSLTISTLHSISVGVIGCGSISTSSVLPLSGGSASLAITGFPIKYGILKTS